MRSKIIGVCMVTYGMFFLTHAVIAVDLRVPQQYGTIASAIKAAQAGDTVVVSAGSYNENLTIKKNITVRSESGKEQTIIDGQNRGSVVVFIDAKFDGVNSARISGFTIQNGYSMEGQGGGVTMHNADAVVENNRIFSNDARVDGGAILINQQSDGVVRNNTIEYNAATRFGGAIFIVNQSDPLIYNNNILHNNTTGAVLSGGGPSGGAIFVDTNSSPQIVENTINNNHADFAGGAISLRAGVTAVIDDNRIENNTAAYGGGVHIETEGSVSQIRGNIIKNNQANYASQYSGSGFGGGISIYNRSRPLITHNTIEDNYASNGGGGIVSSENAVSTISGNVIKKNRLPVTSGNFEGGGLYVADSQVSAYNNIFSENEARLGGGIALLRNAGITLQNNTIVKNIAAFDASRPSGGGIFVQNTISYATISNNIISQNQDYQIFEEYKKASLQYNLMNDNNRGTYFNWDSGAIHSATTLNASGMINAEYNVDGNEKFFDINNDDFHIASDSAAVDKGGSSIISGYDIDYRFRTGTPDIGAYEFVTVTKKTNPVYRFWSDTSKHHFYTINKAERNVVLSSHIEKEWKYEGEGFRAYTLDDCEGQAVFRFWSDMYRGHFYTIDAGEKDHVINFYPDNEWKYEGEAYCAQNGQVTNTTPLYRFWSDVYHGHFYTIDAGEKDYVINAYDDREWKYEGVGYYVYPN